MAGESYAAGGIRTTVAATRAATDEQLAANVARLVAEMRRQGTTTVEIKSGYGLTIARRGPRPGDRAAVHRRDHVPRRARRAAGVRRRPGRLRRARHRADARSRRAAREVDRRVLRARRLRRRPGAHDPRRRAARQGLQGRLHANQLGPGPGVRLACELGLTAVDHCTYLDDADVDALADSGTVATLLPGVEFSTRSPYPDARAPARRRRHGRARQRLQPRLLLHLVDAAVHRPGRPRDADDPGRGRVVGHRRRRRARCAATTSAYSPPARART